MPVSRNRKKSKRRRSKARSKARDTGWIETRPVERCDLECGDYWSKGLHCRHGWKP